MSKNNYLPPYRITPSILRLIEQVGEAIGQIQAQDGIKTVPLLRRNNRVKTIQASLEIEGNTLDLDQVTALLAGKRVLGPPREIQEVQNAFKAYDGLPGWSSSSCDDLLEAHAFLMDGLVSESGRFRSGGVGIQRGNEMVHVAPPADRVPGLIADLLHWLKTTEIHPLVASCVFHYEFEFIHPFQDGNGRLGRLWQTLVLSEWKVLFSMLPVESVVRDRQQEYYAALGASDQTADSTAFTEFMLLAVLDALQELATATDQVGDQVGDQVKRLLGEFDGAPLSALDLMNRLGLSHRPTFRKNYLHPALSAGLIEMTHPDSPRAKNQKYRITQRGKAMV